MGKTAAEPKATERQTAAVMTAVLKRLSMPMRGSVTFDKPRQQSSGSLPARTEVSRPPRASCKDRGQQTSAGHHLCPHALLRGLLGATTYFCDAPKSSVWASWQMGGIENANGRIRRWLPRTAELDAMAEADIQEIAMTLNLTPRKCLGFKSPVDSFLAELGKNIAFSFRRPVALRA